VFLPALGFPGIRAAEIEVCYYAEGDRKMVPFIALNEKPDHRGNANRIAFRADSEEEVDRLGAIIRQAGAHHVEGPEYTATTTRRATTPFFSRMPTATNGRSAAATPACAETAAMYSWLNPCIVGPLGLKEIWTTEAADICPLTLTTFWAEHALWGLNPAPYHLLNVLLHGACALLLWQVLRSLRMPGAWLAARLWALHHFSLNLFVTWATGGGRAKPDYCFCQICSRCGA
jgi:hypothetical protein